MKRTYICSPLSAPTLEGIHANMLFARAKCDEYRAAGFYAPWAPHAWLPEFMDDNSAEEREIALKFGQMMLANSDTIVVCGYNISSGMKGEIDFAVRNNFRIIVEADLERQFLSMYPKAKYLCSTSEWRQENSVRAVSAIFTSVWDGGLKISTDCKVNMKTGEIFDIEQSKTEVEGTLDKEYITINGVKHDVYRADERDYSHFCFWYV